MSDYSTRNIIDYAMDDDGVKFREALYSQIHDKVSAHIQAAKEQMAKNLITPEEDSEEEYEKEYEEEYEEEYDSEDSEEE
jgi:hypothetical protein